MAERLWGIFLGETDATTQAAWTWDSLPGQCATRLVLGDPRFEEVFLLTQVGLFVEPGQDVLGAGERLGDADLAGSPVGDEAELGDVHFGVVAEDGLLQDVAGVGGFGRFCFVPQCAQGGRVERQVFLDQQFADDADAEGAVQYLVAHDVLQLLGGAFHQAAPLQREDRREAVVEPAALEDHREEEVGEREFVQVGAGKSEGCIGGRIIEKGRIRKDDIQ